MSKKYFKTISLIEGIYLEIENEKILLYRDWSKYFDFKIIYLGENLLENGIEKYLKKNKKSSLSDNDITDLIKNSNKTFKEGLKNLFNNHQNLYDLANKSFVFDILNKEEKNINKRIYGFNKNKTSDFLEYEQTFNTLLKSYFLTFKYSIDKNIFFDFDEHNLDFCILRKFNFEEFFLQNEALFDINNDFYNSEYNSKKIQLLIGKLPINEENGKNRYLKTIENMINSLEIKDENIFRINIKFDLDSFNKKVNPDYFNKLKIKDKDLEQKEKKYNFFFFERSEYLVFDIDKNG